MRAVIDTNVLFEGLTKQGGACGLIVEAWLNGLFSPCVSLALAYEYADVLARKLSPARWSMLAPTLELLLNQAEAVDIYYSWRPTSPDPGDDLVIDCAMNASAVIVSRNIRDFRTAGRDLGVRVLSPAKFVNLLAQSAANADTEGEQA